MFYLRYLRSELVRREGATILTLLGLGARRRARDRDLGALARARPRAEDGARPALEHRHRPDGDAVAAAGPGRRRFGGRLGRRRRQPRADRRRTSRRSPTSRSSASRARTSSTTSSCPGTQLTFPQTQAKQVAALDGVAAVDVGLTSSPCTRRARAEDRRQAQDRRPDRSAFQRNIPRPTAARVRRRCRRASRSCARQNGGSAGAAAARNGGGGFGGGGGGGGGGGFGGGFDRGAFAKCLPAGLRQLPHAVHDAAADAPAGAEPAADEHHDDRVHDRRRRPDAADDGRRHDRRWSRAAASSRRAAATRRSSRTTYAAKHKLKVGSKLDLNGTTFTVVGLVKPPLGGQSADVYVPLAQLQKLAGQRALANVVLVRADRAARRSAPSQKAIKRAFPNAQVASSKQVADQISGSLVDASNLSHGLGLVLSIVAAAAAFLLAALLALSSVGKRVRELGTLKALGWTQRMVVRQVVGESLAQGVARRPARRRARRRRRARDRRLRADADRERATGGGVRAPRRRHGRARRRAPCRSPRRSRSPSC